ncbi:O14A2 protein, partial [Pachycephala philippinensis]|nr:O14A2 protein [Pachycephala philippinensis]
LVFSVCLGFGCFVFILFYSVQIFRAMLRIPSEQGQHKAMCFPPLDGLPVYQHFHVYLKPRFISSLSLDLVVSVLYSVVSPALIPLIYSLRNQELKVALKKLRTGCF